MNKGLIIWFEKCYLWLQALDRAVKLLEDAEVVPAANVAGSRLALRTLVFRAIEGLGLALLNTYR